MNNTKIGDTMKPYCSSSKAIPGVFALIFLVMTVHLSTDATAQTPRRTNITAKGKASSQESRESDRFVSIDFNNVDISVFIKFISELTAKNFVIDQRVKGKVTIISPARISVKEAYKVFESVLEVHGYATVKAGEVIKIVPAPDARSKNIKTMLKKEAASPEDKVVTQLIPLKYATASEIKTLFTPLISKSSVILAYAPTNMLIVTDVYSNIQRLLRLLNAIDVAGMGQELSVIPLVYADATKFVRILDTVFQAGRRPKGKDLGTTVKFVADERTNTVIVLASEVETIRVKKLIQLLDRETPRGKEKIHVHYLENASAEELAKVLQALPTKRGTSGDGKKAPSVSGEVKITADKATNSLIIMGDKEDYLVLEEIIQKLDIPRSMVFIESVLMEVNVDKDFELGVEWQAGGKTDLGDKKAAFGGAFNREAFGRVGPSDFPADVFSLGIITESITIAGVEFPNLAAIVKAFQKDKDVHILSTPQILTTDNEEATITVGKNVPFQTRADTTDTLTDYSTYEYKDVGITLKITPQISKDRLVRLSIAQEITKLDELATTSEERPTTFKRSIDTTVIVRDKNTVVIGGLIDDSYTETENKVPCLGDIPLLGYLFKSKTRATERTNLYVFLTPHVIESPLEATKVYQNKKQEMDTIKEGNIKLYERDVGEPQPKPKP
jgi:general secretion pathway protein D